jgi:hypothetical protein
LISWLDTIFKNFMCITVWLFKMSYFWFYEANNKMFIDSNISFFKLCQFSKHIVRCYGNIHVRNSLFNRLFLCAIGE